MPIFIDFRHYSDIADISISAAYFERHYITPPLRVAA